MPDRSDPPHDEPEWEKPDFEVTPLDELEQRPGFDDGSDDQPSQEASR